ncbi:MAG: carboxyl transferase domain-containing protein, partial [Chloroflexota bacterium]
LKQKENSGADRDRLVNEFRDKFAGPYRSAASGHVDDILVPAETRPRLIAALELLRDKQASSPAKKHGTMPL